MKKLYILLICLLLTSCSYLNSNQNNNLTEDNEIEKCLNIPHNSTYSFEVHLKEISGYPSIGTLDDQLVKIELNKEFISKYPQIYVEQNNNIISFYYYVCNQYFMMGQVYVVDKETYDYYQNNNMIDGVYPIIILGNDDVYLVNQLSFEMAIGEMFNLANPDFDENDESSQQEKEEYLEFEEEFVAEQSYIKFFNSIERILIDF